MACFAFRLGIRAEELLGDVDDDMRDEKLVLGNATVPKGRQDDAVSLLTSVAPRLPEQLLPTDDIAFRVAHVYATDVERTGRLHEAVAVSERLRVAAKKAPGTPAVASRRCGACPLRSPTPLAREPTKSQLMPNVLNSAVDRRRAHQHVEQLAALSRRRRAPSVRLGEAIQDRVAELPEQAMCASFS